MKNVVNRMAFFLKVQKLQASKVYTGFENVIEYTNYQNIKNHVQFFQSRDEKNTDRWHFQ